MSQFSEKAYTNPFVYFFSTSQIGQNTFVSNIKTNEH